MKLAEYFDRTKLNIKFTIVTLLVTVFPIAILSGVLFYNMEQSVINEHSGYMEYKMEQSDSTIAYGVDSINMSTQFFLTDDEMRSVLTAAQRGEELTTSEILDFQERDIINLERLVNNNPLLYTVRIFASNDRVQELMPILYKKSRMEKMSWAVDTEKRWQIGYYDTAFSSLITNQDEELICLLTPIVTHDNEQIGVIEASMRMATMFPGLYENKEDEWSFFVEDDGTIHLGAHDSPEFQMQTELILGELEKIDKKSISYIKQGRQKLIVTYLPLPDLNGALVSVEDIGKDVWAVYRMRNIFVMAMIAILTLLAVLINLIVRRMLRQFYTILDRVRSVQDGNLRVRIEQCSNDEVGELANQLNMMLDHIQTLMDENIKREILVKNSEIRALQNQINAHFIYNVLESIKMMAEIDEKYEISDAITALGKLLRYSMRWVSGNVKLKEELEYIRSYMVLINLRYDYEVILSLSLPDALLNQEIPKMSLQPIVENAILHGIEPLSEDSTIYIKGWLEETDCVIEITDAGQGMTETQVKELEAKIAGDVEPGGGNGHGIGLKNVQDRIQMSFGKNYGLSIASKLDCYTKVAIRLPRNIIGAENR